MFDRFSIEVRSTFYGFSVEEEDWRRAGGGLEKDWRTGGGWEKGWGRTGEGYVDGFSIDVR